MARPYPRRMPVVVLCLTWFGVAASADGPRPLTFYAPSDDQPSPAHRLDAIRTGVADAEAAFRGEWEKQKPDYWPMSPKVEQLQRAYESKRQAGRLAALEIAKLRPESDTGYDALEWVLTDVQYGDGTGKAALELMTEHHAANPKVGKVAALLGYYPPHEKSRSHGAAVALLKAVAARNPERVARGQAELGLAWQAKWAYELAEYEAAIDPERFGDVERRAAEAEAAFNTVSRKYGDCPNLRAKGGPPQHATLGEEVEPVLYELRNLRTGKPAPEIDAEDLEGARFKLGDYRGKVILLVFWASWCSPCMADVPHERELVERFQGRPFVLIGVNGDETRAAAAKAVAQHQISWRSFWNGEGGADGPITDAWNVRGWPTVYVIDHNGTLRAKGLRGKALDGPLEKLVAAAEASDRRPR